MTTPSSVEALHVVASSTVGCASASNDNKITGRQTRANTNAKQQDLDMSTALVCKYSTDRVSLLFDIAV